MQCLVRLQRCCKLLRAAMAAAAAAEPRRPVPTALALDLLRTDLQLRQQVGEEWSHGELDPRLWGQLAAGLRPWDEAEARKLAGAGDGGGGGPGLRGAEQGGAGKRERTEGTKLEARGSASVTGPVRDAAAPALPPGPERGDGSGRRRPPPLELPPATGEAGGSARGRGPGSRDGPRSEPPGREGPRSGRGPSHREEEGATLSPRGGKRGREGDRRDHWDMEGVGRGRDRERGRDGDKDRDRDRDRDRNRGKDEDRDRGRDVYKESDEDSEGDRNRQQRGSDQGWRGGGDGGGDGGGCGREPHPSHYSARERGGGTGEGAAGDGGWRGRDPKQWNEAQWAADVHALLLRQPGHTATAAELARWVTAPFTSVPNSTASWQSDAWLLLVSGGGCGPGCSTRRQPAGGRTSLATKLLRPTRVGQHSMASTCPAHSSPYAHALAPYSALPCTMLCTSLHHILTHPCPLTL